MLEVGSRHIGTCNMRLVLVVLLVAVPVLQAYDEFAERTRDEVSYSTFLYLQACM